jgi:hypothetical protein
LEPRVQTDGAQSALQKRPRRRLPKRSHGSSQSAFSLSLPHAHATPPSSKLQQQQRCPPSPSPAPPCCPPPPPPPPPPRPAAACAHTLARRWPTFPSPLCSLLTRTATPSAARRCVSAPTQKSTPPHTTQDPALSPLRALQSSSPVRRYSLFFSLHINIFLLPLSSRFSHRRNTSQRRRRATRTGPPPSPACSPRGPRAPSRTPTRSTASPRWGLHK